MADTQVQTAPAGPSAFELQRRQAQAGSVEERKRQQEAIERRAAAQGFGEGSGVLEKREGIADVERSKALSTRLGQIDVGEAQAAEAREETQRSREFASGEREAGQTFQSEQADFSRELIRETRDLNLNIQEQQMAEQARQFNSQQEFTVAMQQAGFQENEINRAWQAAQNAEQRAFVSQEAATGRTFQADQADFDRELSREFQTAGLSLQEQQMAENARQFDSQQAFTLQMQTEGFQENEIIRAWQAAQNAEARAFQSGETERAQSFQLQLTDLQNQFATGIINLQDSLAQSAEIRGAQARSAYNKGATGGVLSQEEANNPLFAAAFSDGQSGKDLLEAEREWEADIQFRNALITSLDPATPEFQASISAVFGEGFDANLPTFQTAAQAEQARRETAEAMVAADPATVAGLGPQGPAIIENAILEFERTGDPTTLRAFFPNFTGQ